MIQYAKIHVLDQIFTNLYDVEDSLNHGTIFKDLHDPYKFMPSKQKFDSKKEQLLYILMQYRFYIWDLHLYLDTHPNNEEALKLKEKYQEDFEKLENLYENNFDILTHDKENKKFRWNSNPWPFEGDISVEV
jgi:spore coat protein JB